MRITLFLATHLALILVASVALRPPGVDDRLTQSGIDSGSLPAPMAVFGFAGALTSLPVSKPSAAATPAIVSGSVVVVKSIDNAEV